MRLADERALLAAVGEELGAAGALVSFNGKSFDAPLLETRYLFHRLEWAAGRTPHLDVLHPARRFWGGAGQLARSRLEAQLLGAPGGLATCQASRFPRGTFSSSAPATPGRWRPCSSTTGSTCCRSPA